MATTDDLDETVRLVKDRGVSVLGVRADVRDLAALERAHRLAIDEFGKIDVLVANAGVGSFGPALEISEQQWQDVIDVDLTGVWKTVRAVAPAMVERGEGGSVILTSSVAGLVAFLNLAHYTAAKHGVVGLMRALAAEFAPHRIRVNSIHPTTVDTPMVDNVETRELFLPGVENPDREVAAELMKKPECVARAVDRGRRCQQRSALARLRGSPLRHRGRPTDRRRRYRTISSCPTTRRDAVVASGHHPAATGRRSRACTGMDNTHKSTP